MPGGHGSLYIQFWEGRDGNVRNKLVRLASQKSKLWVERSCLQKSGGQRPGKTSDSSSVGLHLHMYTYVGSLHTSSQESKNWE